VPFRPLMTALLCLFVTGCAARRIPGTEIQDTEDTRAIIGVMKRLNQALEARDAEAVRALLAPSFRDDAGTPSPDDDLTYDNVTQVLPARLAHLQDVRLEVSLRRVDVEGDKASAVYHWNASYRMPKLESRPQNDSDLERMLLVRHDGQWRIESGI
jgi:uncharacterized protein (TIGR02246 family)